VSPEETNGVCNYNQRHTVHFFIHFPPLFPCSET